MCVSDGSIFLFSVCFFNQYIIFLPLTQIFFLNSISKIISCSSSFILAHLGQ